MESIDFHETPHVEYDLGAVNNHRLSFSREIARASGERDKAIAALKLDRDAKDSIIDALYCRVPAPGDNGGDLEDK